MTLLLVAFVCALVPALLFLKNLAIYRPPVPTDGAAPLPSVSVLIPARNEEGGIAAAVRHVLASQGIEIEVIVLDDASSDRTAEIVRTLAQIDTRVRCETAPPLPPGWNGKQHACSVLASLARYETLCFLDADVRLAPAALARMAGFLASSRSELVSGFPHEETGTFFERLLIPLIHFILLGFLPLTLMRQSSAPGFAAGCGQFLMVRRSAYVACGGHSTIRTTMHDGLLLPHLFRAQGFRTDLADLTELASCRMYRNAREVWNGLAKNATEGMGAPARIVPFSVFLLLGQVLPIFLLLAIVFSAHPVPIAERAIAYGALVAGYMPRLIAVVRYRQSFTSALLHPLGVAVLLVLQWYALTCKLAGRSFTWKQRAYEAG